MRYGSAVVERAAPAAQRTAGNPAFVGLPPEDPSRVEMAPGFDIDLGAIAERHGCMVVGATDDPLLEISVDDVIREIWHRSMEPGYGMNGFDVIDPDLADHGTWITEYSESLSGWRFSHRISSEVSEMDHKAGRLFVPKGAVYKRGTVTMDHAGSMIAIGMVDVRNGKRFNNVGIVYKSPSTAGYCIVSFSPDLPSYCSNNPAFRVMHEFVQKVNENIS